MNTIAEQVQQPESHWIQPEPLRAPLPPAEPYPVDSMGRILGDAVNVLHETVKAPMALCAQSVLASASFAVQSHFDIKMPWGERKPTSLFMLTVGESGERKSGIDDLVLGAAKAQEKTDMEKYRQDIQEYEAELSAWKSANEKAKRKTAAKNGTVAEFRRSADEVGPAPRTPLLPLKFVTDPTVEGLFKLLAVGQPSVALFSDEGGLLIGGHALNTENALKTMARWCKLWDGSPFDRVRAGDGSGILYGRRMALHQLAQPDVMTTLLSDRTANGQGFLARCLVAWPESTIGTRQTKKFTWAGDRPEIKRLFAVMMGLLETPPPTHQVQAQELEPIVLDLAKDAQELALAATNEFENLMAKGEALAEIRDRGSKAMDNAMRIAGVMAVIEGGLSTRTVSAVHLQRALVIVQWYLGETLRIRGATAIPQSVLDAEVLLDWIHNQGCQAIYMRKILQYGPNALRNKPRLAAAIKELEDNGYLKPNEPGIRIEGVKVRKSWQVLPGVF